MNAINVLGEKLHQPGLLAVRDTWSILHSHAGLYRIVLNYHHIRRHRHLSVTYFMNNDSATKASPARCLINTRQSTVLIHNNHINFYTLLFCSLSCHTKIQPVTNAMVVNIRSPFVRYFLITNANYKCGTKYFTAVCETLVYQLITTIPVPSVVLNYQQHTTSITSTDSTYGSKN